MIALHKERIQQTFAFSSFENGLDPVDALDHQLLEEELKLQLDLLKDELNPVSFHEDQFITPIPTLDTEKYERDLMDFIGSTEGKAVAPPMITSDTVDASTKTLDKDEPSLQSFMKQKEDLFLMPSGSSESIGIIVALWTVFLLDMLRMYLANLYHG